MPTSRTPIAAFGPPKARRISCFTVIQGAMLVIIGAYVVVVLKLYLPIGPRPVQQLAPASSADQDGTAAAVDVGESGSLLRRKSPAEIAAPVDASVNEDQTQVESTTKLTTALATAPTTTSDEVDSVTSSTTRQGIGPLSPQHKDLRESLQLPRSRYNLPAAVDVAASSDFRYSGYDDPVLLPPSLHGDQKCGNRAPVVAAWVPAWNALDPLPQWCLSQPQPSHFSADKSAAHSKGSASDGAPPTVYLAAHIYIRVYEKDLSGLTKLDLAHWLTYYRYAGFQRVYIYDCWLYDWEKVDSYPPIAEAIRSGFVVYEDWHEGAAANYDYRKQAQKAPHMRKVQYPASEHVMQEHGHQARWISFMDVDEYPFQKSDMEPGFMSRFLVHTEQNEAAAAQAGASSIHSGMFCTLTTQHKFENYLCKGGREVEAGKDMLIQQVPRRIVKPLNRLVKQIVRMDARGKFAVHTSQVKYGKTREVPAASSLIMLHFQGGRQTEWLTISEYQKKDPSAYASLMASTVPVDMGPIPERILACFDPDQVASWPTLQEDRANFEAAHPGKKFT